MMNSLEIHGITEDPQENVLSIVKEVEKGLISYQIEDFMIDAYHHLGQKKSQEEP